MANWVLQSRDPALTLRLPAGSVKTLGRTARADFILDAALVSRLHCRLTATAGADSLFVEDLDSTNGVLVNGRKVRRDTLRNGDRLTVGRVEFDVTLAN